jgi:hypothetical protein
LVGATYFISGRVATEKGNPISGVEISAGEGITATTDATGNYTITNLISDTYTLTTTKEFHSFTPSSLEVTVPPDQSGQDFVGIPLIVYLPMIANNYCPDFFPDDTRGLTATNFALQDRSDYTVNGRIWFEFTIVNNSGGDVAYNRLGVLPKKDGVDRFDWFQQSYGGPNATMKPAGRVHEDNIKLPETGNYTLRLAICFETWEACNGSGGNWVTLSPELPANIN